MKKLLLKMKVKLAEFALKKFAGGWMVDLYEKLEGNKTQIGLVALAVASGLVVFGVIDEDAYNKAVIVIGTWTGKSLAEKGVRYKQVFQIAKDLKVEAEDVVATGKKLKEEVEAELKKS